MLKNKPFILALVVASGSGERFHSDLPKQYQPLLGKAVLRWSVERLAHHPLMSGVCIAYQPDHKDLYAQAVDGLSLLPPVFGGATRQETVRRGLEHLVQYNPDYILIHDAARPMLTDELITSLCLELENAAAVIPALPVTDSVKRVLAETVDRSEDRNGLYTVQTPQAFHFDTLYLLHKNTPTNKHTDDASLFEEANLPVKAIAGNRTNIKLTYPEDIFLLEQFACQENGDVRTGQGYDVHRLVTPKDTSRKLMLCGVAVPHGKILEGHSDADVALHAVTDALLATICKEDIGFHFSPKDQRWKNADSAKFLRHAADLVMEEGGVIAHVDVTIVGEEPKISPHRAAMRLRLAEILHLPVTRISVKATTTEGLGFTGRKEGIAAYATATVRLPFIKQAQAVAPVMNEKEDILPWATKQRN